MTTDIDDIDIRKKNRKCKICKLFYHSNQHNMQFTENKHNMSITMTTAKYNVLHILSKLKLFCIIRHTMQ